MRNIEINDIKYLKLIMIIIICECKNNIPKNMIEKYIIFLIIGLICYIILRGVDKQICLLVGILVLILTKKIGEKENIIKQSGGNKERKLEEIWNDYKNETKKEKELKRKNIKEKNEAIVSKKKLNESKKELKLKKEEQKKENGDTRWEYIDAEREHHLGWYTPVLVIEDDNGETTYIPTVQDKTDAPLGQAMDGPEDTLAVLKPYLI